jgi:hypothetical protein
MIHYICLFGLILTSCTHSVNLGHTQDTASDVVEESQATEPNISPNVQIPKVINYLHIPMRKNNEGHYV